uniref:Uncharacterized protein n=1 Tax=Magallana gigas TaxID=29159 RepID=A0A8W8MHB5_MAGGI
MITLQDHAASDTHDPYICRKNEELEHKIHKGRNMDDDEKWNNDQSASEKYSRNVLVDKLQLPLKGQTFNPVVRGFLEQLKRKGDMAKDVEIENIGQYGKYHLQLRDTDLNAKELKNTDMIKRALTPNSRGTPTGHRQFYEALKDIQTPTSFIHNKEMMKPSGEQTGSGLVVKKHTSGAPPIDNPSKRKRLAKTKIKWLKF